MAEAMTYTEDSYGMDGKANWPNLTADVNWQGLEDLYSVNESIYEYRQDYRLSLGDWTNYLKDVDRIFALLNSHHEQSKANKSEGFLAESPELSVLVEVTSSESDEDPKHATGGAPPMSWPADQQPPPLNKPTFSPESTLEWDNDIPEVGRLNPEHWRNHKTETWVEHKEINHMETDFSGNGLTEGVLQLSPRLQPMNKNMKEFPQNDGLKEEPAFQDQFHHPMHSDLNAIHLRNDDVSNREQPINSSIVKQLIKMEGENDNQEGFPSVEGSALLPLSSD